MRAWKPSRRKLREKGLAHNMRFYKNLPIDIYVGLMARTACLVGNSSSGIREGAYIGTPVVNIGTRQAGRERGHNVVDAPHHAAAILGAIASPDFREDDPEAGRERFYRADFPAAGR